MRLTDSAVFGRDNNFNLIRLVAALSVLVAHSWALALGPGVVEPFGVWTGMSMGTIAVDVFFMTSGFLVTASLMRRGVLLDFAVARVLRIYPALIVVVLACVVLGLAFSTLPWADFLTHRATLKYLWKNALAFRGAEFNLPGAFPANPFPFAMNGSLWTLVWELRMYFFLGLLWWWASYAGHRRHAAASWVIVGLAVATTALHLVGKFAPGVLPKSLVVNDTLVPGFLLGGACYVLRSRVRLETAWFVVALAVVLACGRWGGDKVLHAAYFLTLPYVVLYLAYVPGGPVRAFNRLGDCSYGVYIFAWPVQQTVVALVPDIGPLGLIACAGVATMALAWWSWRFVEQPALRQKQAVAAAVRGAFAWRPRRAAALAD